jgi:hypothetical protein
LDRITFVPVLGISTGSSAFFLQVTRCSVAPPELRYASRLDLPVSDPLGSASSLFFCYFSLRVFRPGITFSFTVRREVACGLFSLLREMIADISICPI